MADSGNNRKYAVIGILLGLLILVGVWLFTEWFIQPTGNRPHVGPEFNDPVAQRNDASPLELEPVKPAEPEVEPEPDKPVIERGPVELPALTRFRALTLEADKALALRDRPDMPEDELWVTASTLDQLNSRFGPYAILAYNGHADAADRVHFESDATRSFERPDVASTTYTVEATGRTAIWLRAGAELPEPDTEPPPEGVPLTRRAQERVNTEILAGWLAAIEGEYGKSDFGEHKLPLDVVLFPTLDEYLKFSSKRLDLNVPQWSAGYYSTKWDVICLPVLDNTSTAEVIRHEMFHAVQAHKAPQSLLVPWFAEGTAEWLDKASPEAQLRTLPTFASAAYGYLRTLIGQGLKLDLGAFLAQDLETFYQNPELNYLIAYCFVDFCRANEDLKSIYFEFWNLMVEGVGHENAFARTFGGLDMNELLRRFLSRINGFPQVDTPPRFSHDAPEEAFGLVPPTLEGRVTAPTKAGEVSEGWFEVLGKLKERGFDTSRSGYLKGDYDVVIVAIDSSETMSQVIDTPNFDFDALSRWLFSLRYAGSLQFTRKSADGSSVEEVPTSVLLAMVDAVLTGRVDEFTETAGVKVGDELQGDIKKSYKQFELSGEKLATLSKREVARHTAESVVWYWGTRQDQANVVVVDYNLNAKVEKEKNAFGPKGYNSSSSPIARLFAKTAPHKAPEGSNGADTDWWGAFQGVLQSANDISAGRIACLFFTDGPNSMGFYGHLESGRDDTQYMLDQEKLAIDLKIQWDNAGLGYDTQPSILQLFSLPGAEGQGLDYIPQKLPQAKLDEWTTHFLKP
ncbi:MAG: hypothetical protein H6839_01200 [Planctomycetes bacterium]|nr:hypothetical protein [Planctomycetota bacterium]